MVSLRLLSKFIATALLVSSSTAHAATINFSGPLAIADLDLGGGVYSGVPIGTIFSGSMDDVVISGSITDGTTATSFDCCIAAGGLGISNDVALSADDADFLNFLAGEPLFSENDIVDFVDIEGDSTTAGDGRIEVGLSYVLNPDAFPDEDPANYPFSPDDVQLSVYFILEEDSGGTDIYSAVGTIGVIPLPAAAWLFTGGLLTLVTAVRRKTT